MQFLHNENAGDNSLLIKDESYRYLIKARRHKLNDLIHFRNLKDNNIYTYEVFNILKKEAILNLIETQEKIIEADNKLHILWSVVDPKTIEKQLPYLNEIGVDKISFYYADYSQKQFKLNFEKFEKILINSSGQCGRSSIIKLEIIDSLEEFLITNPDTYALNFSDKNVSKCNINTIALGCEGGFSEKELSLFNKENIVGFSSNLILRSETAITALASKIFL